jgi:16S rRNA (uracil1498-N3)-methyltransferase
MATISRLYHPDLLTVGSVIQLDARQHHHLLTVLRARVGEQIILFNGQGGQYHSEILAINKQQITIAIQQFQANDSESSLAIHLGQAIARGEKMDWIMQKAVELGVATISPICSERVTVRLDAARQAKRLSHWQGIIVNACEQCGRNRLPSLSAVSDLSPWLAANQAQKKFILSPHPIHGLSETNTLKTIRHEHLSSISILVGPEGGFSEQEVQKACDFGFVPIQFGPRILRTETAAIAILATLQYQFGDI